MDLSFSGPPTRVVSVDEETQVGQARRVAQQLATEAGFDEADAGRVTLVATELASNLLKHAKDGQMHMATVQGDGAVGVELIAVDRGPGFNLVDCLPDGFSTGGTRGEGLGAVKRQTQVMDMYADPRGSIVMARLYPRAFPKADLRYGVSQHRLGDEEVCGDSWAVRFGPEAINAMLVDGLGHGEPAHEAAEAATRMWLEEAANDPVQVMERLHQAMTGTRGGAVALARFEPATRTLRYTGIGNISGSLQDAQASRGLASHPGIVGVQSRRTQPFDFRDVGGRMLVMHSDGLQSRWTLRDYPGLTNRHPAVVAALLHRDFTRGRDDATVLALRLDPSP